MFYMLRIIKELEKAGTSFTTAGDLIILLTGHENFFAQFGITVRRGRVRFHCLFDFQDGMEFDREKMQAVIENLRESGLATLTFMVRQDSKSKLVSHELQLHWSDVLNMLRSFASECEAIFRNYQEANCKRVAQSRAHMS